VFVKEEDGAKGLVLGGGGHVLADGQMVQEGFNFGGIHLLGMAHFVEADEAADPLGVSFFGTDGIMLAAHNGAHPVEQFGRVGLELISRAGGFFEAQVEEMR
jgi:hypothetical protein